MTLLDRLNDLQAIDIRIEDNARARQETAKRLADDSTQRAAQSAFDDATRRAHEIRAHVRALELEVNGLDDKIKSVTARLYGGKVTNPKELSGLDQDVKMLRRRLSELEDQLLGTLAEVDSAETEMTNLRAAHDKIVRARNESVARDTAALRELGTAGEELRHARAHAAAQIPAVELQRYESLRGEKKGRAVTHLKGTACALCGFTVPSGLASRARVGEELVFCSNCGRILAP